MLEKFLKQTKFSSQEDFIKNFRINVPENFNFGYDVVDEWARIAPEKKALCWTNEQDHHIDFTFADIKRESDKTAAFFLSLGIKRGDMVMLILKRRYEFWFSIIALHKLGAVVIPATHLLTKKDIVYRNTARENDLICVSGNLGAAYMGLQLLEREKVVFKENPNAQPDFSGYEYILERQLKPEARMDIIQLLKEKGIKPTAMMDVSDGLSSEVLHICHDSGLGCNIYEEKIPIDYQTFKMAEELNMNATVCALSGGEDYELLFTTPLDAYDKLITMEEISIIGHTCAKSEGYNLITKDGNSFELKAQGWVNFNPSEEK